MLKLTARTDAGPLCPSVKPALGRGRHQHRVGRLELCAQRTTGLHLLRERLASPPSISSLLICPRPEGNEMLRVALVLDQAKLATAGQLYRCGHELLPPGNEVLFSALLDPPVPRRIHLDFGHFICLPWACRYRIACRGWFTPETYTAPSLSVTSQ